MCFWSWPESRVLTQKVVGAGLQIGDVFNSHNLQFQLLACCAMCCAIMIAQAALPQGLRL